MSATRFNRKVGKRHGQWLARRDKSIGPLRDVLTRQARRILARAKAWALLSHENRPRDDRGPIPRRVRRSMALALAKRKPTPGTYDSMKLQRYPGPLKVPR